MELVFSILNTLGLAGVAIYLYFVLTGLKDKINTLQGTINAQKETLEAVRERADEFNRLSQGYKQALDDFEQMGKKLDERRKELVKELEEANQRKDEKLIEFRNLELKEIELKQKSLEALPDLEARLEQVVNELDSKIKILASSTNKPSIGNVSLLRLLASSSSLPCATSPASNLGLIGLLAKDNSRLTSSVSPSVTSILATMRLRQLIENAKVREPEAAIQKEAPEPEHHQEATEGSPEKTEI